MEQAKLFGRKNWESMEGGYFRDEIRSLLQKAIRRGLEEEALFCSRKLISAGLSGYLWKTLSVILCEDIGLANPSLPLVFLPCLKQFNPSLDKWSREFDPACADYIVSVMSRSPKSRETDELAAVVGHDVSPMPATPKTEYELTRVVFAQAKNGKGRAALERLKGLAFESDDHLAVPVVYALCELFEFQLNSWSSGPWHFLALAHAVLFLKRKGHRVGTLAIPSDIEIPACALDMHTKRGRKILGGKDAQYRHWYTSGAIINNAAGGSTYFVPSLLTSSERLTKQEGREIGLLWNSIYPDGISEVDSLD